MALQILKVTAVVLADISDAKVFGQEIQEVLVKAVNEHRFRHGRDPAMTILASSNSVSPASDELVKRYVELERLANEATSLSAER